MTSIAGPDFLAMAGIVRLATHREAIRARQADAGLKSDLGQHRLAFDPAKPENSRMALEFTTSYLKDSAGSAALLQAAGRTGHGTGARGGACLRRSIAESNSIAILVKHMHGNMRSRWTDFLTTDGEKPDRNRDTEFEAPPKTRAELMAQWEAGWKYVFDALAPLQRIGPEPSRRYTHRSAFGDAGHQPRAGALRVSHRADRVPGQAFCRARTGRR